MLTVYTITGYTGRFYRSVAVKVKSFPCHINLFSIPLNCALDDPCEDLGLHENNQFELLHPHLDSEVKMFSLEGLSQRLVNSF